MKKRTIATVSLLALVGLALGAGTDEIISAAMKKYHKAPKGEVPICKKCADGQATEADLTELLKAYEDMAKVEPPKGTKESWKSKTDALIASVKDLQKDPKNTASYKAAVNCKGCHTDHKAD